MARVELPESRLKARKRRRRVRIGLLVGGSLLALGALMVGLSYIPALLVRSVVVTGAETISSSTIQSFAEARLKGSYLLIFPKRNIFLYPKQQIMDDLMREYSLLSSAEVHASDFHTIAVNVVERHPRALWCEGRCYFMDENGVVYGEAPTFSAPVYLSYEGAAQGEKLPRQYLTPTQFQTLSALVDAIAQKLQGEEIVRVRVDEHSDVRVDFASGFILMFSLKDEAGDVFERLTLSLKAEPFSAHALGDFEYLDLRFGDKLYYKLK